MSWLNNTASKIYITIDGVDYSNELISGQITDGSAINTGAVLTGGIFDFAELPGADRLEDYDQTKFGRGKVVLIDIEIQGERKRHPRGYLYVLGSTYNMENRTMALEAGCILTLHNLTEEIGDLESFTIFPLTQTDEEVPTFGQLITAINTEGAFLWQDNKGDVLKTTFYEGDGLGSLKADAAWVSVRNYTALSISPVGSAAIVPDLIKVNYTWQVEADTDTGTDPVTGKPTEVDESVSTYWLEHPANLRKKQKVCTTNPRGERTCRDVMVNTAKRQYSVTKRTASRRTYGATGGSVSVENELTSGPAVELNGAYYAELYAYQLSQNDGNPIGIDPKGLDLVTQFSRERSYEYGSGGEVLRTIEKSYKNLLGAMTTNDWRAGNSETGIIYNPEDPVEDATRGFLTSPPKDQMFLESVVTTDYTYFDDRTIENQRSLVSSAGCNGVGVYPPTGDRIVQDIGALNNGVMTSVKRTSTGGLLNPSQPPRNPGGTTVITKAAVFVQESAKYLPTEAGSIVLNTNVPFAIAGASENEMRGYASNYARILRAELEGDAAGIRIAESMRPEIFGYRPGMPFSFFDTQLDKLIKLRMNSTGWAIAPGQAIFSTEGCFVGESNGTVVIPDNTDPGALVELGKEVTEKKKVVEEIQEEKDATEDVRDEAKDQSDAAVVDLDEKEATRDDAAADKALAEADVVTQTAELADAVNAESIAQVDRDTKEAANAQAQSDQVAACSADPDSQGCIDATATADAAQADLDAAESVLADAEEEVLQQQYELGVAEENVITTTAELEVAEAQVTEAEQEVTDTGNALAAAEDALTEVQGELDVAQGELDEALDAYEEADQGIVEPPTVEDETVVDSGGDTPAIVEFIGVELTVGLGAETGNGNDGIGVIYDWSVPEEIRFNTNQLLFVSGEKVSKDATILSHDLTGTIPEDGNGSLLVTTEDVIIPDLFDPNVQRNPDEVFVVQVAAAATSKIFVVNVFAKTPDQTFVVKTSAKQPDQTFLVEAIKTFGVSVAQLPFIVEVGPELPYQIYDVTTMAEVPDKIFEVTRGPVDPFATFEVLVGSTYVVTTSFAIPDKIFSVVPGPRPAPAADVIFDISVGGTDAPPIPEPFQIFEVSTSWASPDRIFEVKIISEFEVDVKEKPFYVTVFAEPADQTFEVTTSARAFDQVFDVQVGPEITNQIFETLVINEFEVDVYERPLFVTLQEAQPSPNNYNYVVTGGGFNFADSPTITLDVGQQFRMQVNTPANTVWIKKDQEDGPGELDPYWGDLTNQGINQGFLYFRPWEPGVYYYQSEFDNDVFGQINVTGDGAAEPDQIFDVTAGIDPDGADEIFEVLVGPEAAGQTYSVTVEGGAPPVHQTFDVRTWAPVANQVFETTIADAPMTWVVENSGAGAYRFRGGDIGSGYIDNHTIEVTTGQTMEFLLNASGHPMWIKANNVTGTGDLNPFWVDRILGQGSQTGYLRVVFNKPGTYYYVCQFHTPMKGQIIVTGNDNSPTSYIVGVEGVTYLIAPGS